MAGISTESRLRATAGITAVLSSLVAIFMLAGLAGYPAKEKFHDGEIVSPVLALELARNTDDLKEVLQTDHPKDAVTGGTAPESFRPYRAVSALKVNTIEDCGFIPLYSLFLLSMVNLFSSSLAKSKIRIAAGLLIAAVAAFDYAENVGIFKALAASVLSNDLAYAIRYPSLAKWALLGTTLVVLGGVTIMSQTPVLWEWVRKLLGAAFVLTGIMLLVATSCPMWFGYANLLFSALVFISAVGLLATFFRV
jgi:hypothetical protein